LKPDCFPLTDGGRSRFSCIARSKGAMPYLVRMIKPNLIFSHNWHVQPNCQRSLRAFRLSGALLDRGPAFTPGCPRTCCACRFCVELLTPSFLREPSKHIEHPSQCQAQDLSSPEAAPTRSRRSSSLANLDRPNRNPSPVQKRRAAQISNINPTEPLGLTGVFSWVMQWLVLCGIPYRGSGALASPDPTN
jgi:hypothetical protein